MTDEDAKAIEAAALRAIENAGLAGAQAAATLFVVHALANRLEATIPQLKGLGIGAFEYARKAAHALGNVHAAAVIANFLALDRALREEPPDDPS